MTLFAYVLLTAATSTAPALMPVQWAQLRIQQRVVVRVQSQPLAPLPRPVVFKEKRGPSCLPMSALAGAAITQASSVDLFLRGGGRFRARLDDDCPALDYYRGFYIQPTKDGRICAGRDTIHSRMGGQCGIRRFRSLVPEPAPEPPRR